MNLIHKNNETILAICLFGLNRNLDILEWHKRVMFDKFGLVINYIECPFPAVSHGYCMNKILEQTVDTLKPDYYFFIDFDCIFLKEGVLDLMYDMAKNKLTLVSQATQSNHKKGPNGTVHHPYASQASILFARELYNKLGKPDCDHWIERSDTAEELTYKAKEMGYIIALMYPSHSIEYTCELDNGCKFGMGNTYGPDLMFHAMRQDKPESSEYFIQKCKEILTK